MNYYEHHIGDYAEATAHLSILEDGAYSRLLRKYYATEQALPADIGRVQRLVGARTDEERGAVEIVLREFFDLRDDGWHQPRCDKLIAAYQAGAPERAKRRANETQRLNRHRDERSELFAVLREAGVRVDFNAPIAEVRAKVSALRTAPSAATASATLETAPATPATATQYPGTTTQAPVAKVDGKRKSLRPLPADFAPDEAGVAAAEGLILGMELEAFRNHHLAKASVMADWQAAWRTWCSNSRKFAHASISPPKASIGSKHTDLQHLNYHEGIAQDGSFV